MTSAPTPSAVRTAQPDDRTAIIDIARECGLFSPGELADIEATLDAFLTGSAKQNRWLVHDTAEGIAAIAYYAPERMTEGTWNLFLLAVHPEHQAHGLGASLVRHVEQNLQAAGARVLLIETSGVPHFAGQRAFYTRLGYNQEARIREFYAPATTKSSTGSISCPLNDPSSRRVGALRCDAVEHAVEAGVEDGVGAGVRGVLDDLG